MSRFPGFVAALLVLGLGACGGRVDLAVEEQQDEEGYTPSTVHRVLGWNSIFNQSVDWAGARSAGIRFAYIKATEGTTIKNPVFADKMHYAQAAGIYAGAYHRCNPVTDDAEIEAKYFWKYAGPAYKAYLGPGYLISPALDVENQLHGPDGYNGGAGKPTISLTEWCNRWFGYVQGLAAADGIKIEQVTYVNSGSAGDLDSGIGGWSWIANTTNGENAMTGGPWDPCGDYHNPWGGCSRWRIWQYRWKVTSPYTKSGDLSNNVFNGTASDIANDIGCTRLGGP